MRRLMSRISVACLLATLASPGAIAQQADGAPGAGSVVGISKYIISVSDADRSAAFYREAFGLALSDGASAVPAAQPIPDLVQQLTGVPAPAMFRATLLAIPGAADGFVFEHTEFTGPARPASRPRVGDPGASWLVLHVRDLQAAIASVKRLGGGIVSTGERPVGNGSGAQAVFARDPDGAFIEIIQPAEMPAGAAPDSFVVESPRLAFVVADAEAAGRFYRDVFGLDVRMPGAWTDDPRLAELPGLPGSRVRSATVTVPGTTLSWQFYEYGGIDRTPYERAIPDPGAAAVGFQVRDVAAALDLITAAGGHVLSAGGRPVAGANLAFARDPSGVLLEVIQVAP